MKNIYKKFLLIVLLSVQPMYTIALHPFFAVLGSTVVIAGSTCVTKWASKEHLGFGIYFGVPSFLLTYSLVKKMVNKVPQKRLYDASRVIANSPLSGILSVDFKNRNDRLEFIVDKFIYCKYPVVWYAQELNCLKYAIKEIHSACAELNNSEAYEYYIDFKGYGGLRAYEELIDFCYKEVKKSKGYFDQFKIWQSEMNALILNYRIRSFMLPPR